MHGYILTSARILKSIASSKLLSTDLIWFPYWHNSNTIKGLLESSFLGELFFGVHCCLIFLKKYNLEQVL